MHSVIDSWAREVAAGADDRVLANFNAMYVALRDHHAALQIQQLECHKALADYKDDIFNKYNDAFRQQQASFSQYEAMVRAHLAERDKEPLYPAPADASRCSFMGP
ncbi:hypothetical protein BGZ73_002217, partial [Actinomortierella ambigua]